MTQNDRVYEYLTKYGTITSLEAITELGVTRLASRIAELKSMGHNITGQMITVKNRFGENVRVKEYKLKDN